MALYRTVSHREHGCTIDKNNLTLHTCKVPKIATKNGQNSQMAEFFQAPKMKLADQSFGDFGDFGGYFGYFLVHFTCMVIRNFRVMICM